MLLAAVFLAGLLTGFGLSYFFADTIQRHRGHRREKRATMPNRPLPRRTATRIFVVLLVGLILTGVACTVSWVRATHASEEATHASQEAKAATRRQSTYVACQARYNQRFARIYKARIEPTADVFDALDRVIFAVSSQNNDQFFDSIKHYLEVRGKQVRALHRNPPPPLPEKVCGTVPKARR